MRSNATALALVAVLLPGCGGGRKSEAPAPGATSGASEGAPAPGAGTRQDEFKFGVAANPQGLVTDETGDVPRGQPAFLSFKVVNPPPNVVVKVAWTTLPDGKKLSEETKAAGPGGFVAFKSQSTEAWALGPYRVVMTLADASDPVKHVMDLGIKDFFIRDKKK